MHRTGTATSRGTCGSAVSIGHTFVPADGKARAGSTPASRQAAAAYGQAPRRSGRGRHRGHPGCGRRPNGRGPGGTRHARGPARCLHGPESRSTVEDLAAHIAGRQRCDSKARLDEIATWPRTSATDLRIITGRGADQTNQSVPLRVELGGRRPAPDQAPLRSRSRASARIAAPSVSLRRSLT